MNARSVAGWRDAVVYQVYPRSFQDSGGDGEGDLAGVRSRLEHVRWLGADAVWLSPVYPSPMADMGYDVSDYTDVHPLFGTLADADALIAEAHELGLGVLFDIVPCHTSIEHPWFREHPDWYIWADGDRPPNNWLSAFGGPAWSRDERSGRWYLHSFYPEQPDLDWRNPEVREAMAGVLRFWQGRGVDGFRLDALTHLLKDEALRDNPPATGPPPLPQPEFLHALDPRHSRNPPDIGDAVAALRAGAPEAFLAGEVYLPSAELGPYLEHLDVAFAFELFHTPWNAADIRDAIEAATSSPALWRKLAWVLSNHDFERLPSRVGERNMRAAALLMLTLPGVAFLFQGDEIGMPDGPGIDPPVDRHGRDAFRHPMRWSDAEPHGGFTTGTPWLPAIAVPGGGVAEQREDPTSLLWLYRDLIALRRQLGDGLELLDAEDGVVAYRRGDDHVVALNLADEPRAVPTRGTVVRHTHEIGGGTPVRTLAPGNGVLIRTTW
jgi:alpha-glucosidase